MKDPFSPFDVECMRLALEQARTASQNGEVPIGAVLAHEDAIITVAHNQVETLCDATAHAEILCLQKAYTLFQDWRLQNTTLYCTLEPCCMCFGSMIQSRIERLVFGAPDIRQGVCGSWVDLSDEGHPIHQFSIQSGLMADESRSLLRQFFQQRRQREKRSCGKAL